MASWAVIIANGKMLMIRRSITTSRPHQWCFVGGRIHTHETPESACIREVREEVGIDITVVKLIQHIKHDYYFLCHLSDDNASIRLKAKECDNFAWITPTELLTLGPIMALKDCIQVLSALGFDIAYSIQHQDKTLS